MRGLRHFESNRDWEAKGRKAWCSAEASGELLLRWCREAVERIDRGNDLVHKATVENMNPLEVGTHLLAEGCGHLVGEIVQQVALVERHYLPGVAGVLFARISAVTMMMEWMHKPCEELREGPRRGVGDIP